MKIQGRLITLCLPLLLLVNTTFVKAERLFEFGAGAFAFTVPEYAGAKESKDYVVPLPYFYYQDDNIKVDREGLLSSLWHTSNWYLDFSASAHIPVKSEDIVIRSNMPDIDWTFQLGPALKYYFRGSPKSDVKTVVEFYGRKAVVTDFSYLNDAGWQYGLSVTNQTVIPGFLHGNVRWQNRATINYASHKFHALYYDIDTSFVDPQRTAYQSDSGYHSTTFSTGLTYRNGQWWLASFLLYRDMNGAKNEGSALLEKTENIAAGFGVAWIFK